MSCFVLPYLDTLRFYGCVVLILIFLTMVGSGEGSCFLGFLLSIRSCAKTSRRAVMPDISSPLDNFARSIAALKYLLYFTRKHRVEYFASLEV
mgnify:CR=1 FL=1